MGKAKKEIVLDANYDDSFDEILLDGVASVKKNEIQQMPINKLKNQNIKLLMMKVVVVILWDLLNGMMIINIIKK